MVKRFVDKHPILVDVITFLLTYFTLGSSLTALTAGSMVAIMTSIFIHINTHHDDFLYLFDLRDFIKDQFQVAKTSLNKMGEDYRQKKLSVSNG
jgi:hypothetical protein